MGESKMMDIITRLKRVFLRLIDFIAYTDDFYHGKELDKAKLFLFSFLGFMALVLLYVFYNVYLDSIARYTIHLENSEGAIMRTFNHSSYSIKDNLLIIDTQDGREFIVEAKNVVIIKETK